MVIETMNTSFSFIDSKFIHNDNHFRFYSGYYKEINDHHTRFTNTLMYSTTLYPSLKVALEYYIRNKHMLTKYESVFICIQLTDNIDNKSYIKIYIDSSFDTNTVREYLSEDEYNNIRELLMELKLRK